MEKDNKKQLSEVGVQTDAIKELTKAVADMAKQMGELKEEWAKWRKAGKF
jgi:histone H3/H4